MSYTVSLIQRLSCVCVRLPIQERHTILSYVMGMGRRNNKPSTYFYSKGEGIALISNREQHSQAFPLPRSIQSIEFIKAQCLQGPAFCYLLMGGYRVISG
jgi:hypothetical protein